MAIFGQTSTERKVRTFSLSPAFLEQFKGKQPKWGPLGFVTYKRTYSRLKPDGTGEEFWETVQRVVEGTFNIQKIHCRNLNLPWNEPKAQNSAQDMYQRIWEFKFLPPGRGLWMMGTDLVYEKGGAALQNCLAYETEVITSEGIQQIGSLAGTDVTVLTSGKSWVSAPIRSFGVQPLLCVTLTRQGVEKKVYATAKHRWFATDRRKAYREGDNFEFTTDQLRAGVHRLQYIFGQSCKGLTPSPFGVAHGMAFGDGGTTPRQRNDNGSMLCGDKDREMLPWFSQCVQHPRPNACAGGAVEVRGLPNFFKSLPPLGETKAYLYGWLAGYFAADGSCPANGQATLCSSVRSNLEFVRSLCSIIGIGTYGISEESCVSNLTGRPHTMYKLSLMRDTLDEGFFLLSQHRKNFNEAGGDSLNQRYWTVKAVDPTDRVEEVFCATVEGTGSFALADNILTGNCAFVSTENLDVDFSEPFTFLMDMSMLGVGVGGDTKGVGKVKLSTPKLGEEAFVVEDSREGWVALVHTVLNSFVGKAHYPRTIDYSHVRPRGAAIKGFGGIASGATPLKQLVAHLTSLLLPKGVTAVVKDGSFQGPEGQTLQWADGEGRLGKAETEFVGEGSPYKITSTIIVDIFNCIGVCVVAGGVRRSAEILFGQHDDKEFRLLKQDPDALRSHRWVSNNSLFCHVGMDYTDIAESIAVNGEPGTAWLDNMRRFSRMGHPADNKDHRVAGANPCVEQSLESSETCCLVETYPAHHEDFDDYKRTLKMAYLYAKTVTLVPTHNPKTNAIVGRNRRIGCSMSGIVQAMNKLGRRTFLDWCDNGYTYIGDLDKLYADWLCVPRSIKMTSVKPSGTTSLLCGATPGIHYPHSEYYIRNIRIQNTSPLLELLRNAGYICEPDAYSQDTTVVSFPIHEPYFVKSKDDVTIWEQFANAADLQQHWADNQVSITITFKKDEAKDIKTCLEVYETKLKAVALLPLADSDHSYVQAPYIKITREEYEAMASKITPYLATESVRDQIDQFCDGETCVIAR